MCHASSALTIRAFEAYNLTVASLIGGCVGSWERQMTTAMLRVPLGYYSVHVHRPIGGEQCPSAGPPSAAKKNRITEKSCLMDCPEGLGTL